MYLWLSNRLHSILTSVLCSKMKQYWLQFHASDQDWIRVEPRGMVQPIAHNLVRMETRYHMVWFSQSQQLCSKWRIKMVAPMKPHTLVIIFANSEGISNNYFDIQQKIMLFRFIISLCTWGYISLGDPTCQHEVWRKILLNTNSWYLTKALKSMHTLFLPTNSAAACLFHWY